MQLTDDTRMTHGIHKGLLMKDVPAGVSAEFPRDETVTGLTEYVADNHEILILEAKKGRTAAIAKKNGTAISEAASFKPDHESRI